MFIGAFDGLAGLVYVYSHIGAIQNDEKMFEKAIKLLAVIVVSLACNRVSDEVSHVHD